MSTRPAGGALESLIPGLSKLWAVCGMAQRAGWGIVESGVVGGTAAAGISGTIPSGERVAADAWTVCGALIEVYRLFCCDDREL